MKTRIFISAAAFCFCQVKSPVFGIGNLQSPKAGQIHEWISEHIEYPEYAKSNKIEDIVYVSFDLENGKINSTQIVREEDPELIEAA